MQMVSRSVQVFIKIEAFLVLLSLSPISRHYVREQMLTFKFDKSTGLDNISPRFER